MKSDSEKREGNRITPDFLIFWASPDPKPEIQSSLASHFPFKILSRVLASRHKKEIVRIETMSGDKQEVQDIEQVQQVYSKYGNLSPAMRRLVLNDPMVKNASPRLLDIWHYTNRFIGATGFVYHAAQVARMCGLAYATKFDRTDFKRHHLEVHGEKGKDWDYAKKSEVFPGLFGEKSRLGNFENSIVLPVPGSTTGETVTVSPGGNAAKFPMLTEKFARHLILSSNGQIGRLYRELMIVFWSAIAKIREEPLTVAKVIQDADEEIEEIIHDTVLEPIPVNKHNEIRDKIADRYNGKIESVNDAGIVDVETKDEVIEVKRMEDWSHGIGQVLGYGEATGKKKRLVLFGEKEPNPICKRVCDKFGISLEILKE